jgi:uridine phosphorylase
MFDNASKAELWKAIGERDAHIAALESAAVASALRVRELEKVLSALVDENELLRTQLADSLCSEDNTEKMLRSVTSKLLDGE